MKRLTKDFYSQECIDLSRALLGKIIVHEPAKGIRLSARIVETEAYLGGEDPACHGFGFRRTERVKPLYLSAGHSYVYFIYGMHFCFNIVAGDERTPEAVLVRAVLPLDGLKTMQKLRSHPHPKNLMNGPGKFCQALAINLSHNAIDLSHSPSLSFYEDGFKVSPSQIQISERIGLGQACGDSLHWPLRFEISI